MLLCSAARCHLSRRLQDGGGHTSSSLVTDGTCDLAATDNYRVATETLALDAGVPGRYALDADACRAASAELRDGKGPVTLSQDARF